MTFDLIPHTEPHTVVLDTALHLFLGLAAEACAQFLEFPVDLCLLFMASALSPFLVRLELVIFLLKTPAKLSALRRPINTLINSAARYQHIVRADPHFLDALDLPQRTGYRQ